MRAGLLSQPQVIRRLNQQFVSTTLTYPEVCKLAEGGYKLASEITGHWSIPLVVVMLKPDSTFVVRLSSLSDLNEVHPETTRRTEAPQVRSVDADVHNTRVFLKAVDFHFPFPAKP